MSDLTDDGGVKRFAQKRRYVKLMAAQVKNPAVVERLTNQLNTVVAPEELFMNESKEKREQVATAMIGRPFFVV